MTAYEFLKKHIDSKKDVARILCTMTQLAAPDVTWGCDNCPFLEQCDIGHDGFMVWLDSEWETPMSEWGKYEIKEH